MSSSLKSRTAQGKLYLLVELHEKVAPHPGAAPYKAVVATADRSLPNPLQSVGVQVGPNFPAPQMGAHSSGTVSVRAIEIGA